MNEQLSDVGLLRILIVNPYPIDADCPIGIMMKNLFSNFGADSIIQYYTNSCEIDKNSKFRSEKITLYNPVINKIKYKIQRILWINHKKKVTDIDKKLRTSGVRSNQWESWIQLLLPFSIDSKLLEEIRLFNPNVIYTQIYSYAMLKYINILSKKISCPVVIHTLDDWMGSNYKDGIIQYIPCYFFTKILKSLLNNGKCHMVASPKMLNYMEKNYGGKYEFVMNCYKYSEIKTRMNNNKVMKIVYAGGLMLERYIGLNQIAQCVELLNQENKKFELHVYAPFSHIEGYRSVMKENIVFHKSIGHEGVEEILTESDILVHVESFNPNVVKFTRYSLSTKIPEYLAVRKPLVYFGPKNVGVAEFLIDNKIGLCVDTVSNLNEQLSMLYHDKLYYEAIASNGNMTGKSFFDVDVMQRKLRKCLKN